MTKEQFCAKWEFSSYWKADLEAVIATEIAKSQEKPQPALNPIAEAYERGEKIRGKSWTKDCWIKKHTESLAICDKGGVDLAKVWSFTTHQHDWELYTEPEQVAKPAEQPAKPFDKERFEAMFRAVVASEAEIDFVFRRNETNYLLEQLDAYYASKNN